MIHINVFSSVCSLSFPIKVGYIITCITVNVNWKWNKTLLLLLCTSILKTRILYSKYTKKILILTLVSFIQSYKYTWLPLWGVVHIHANILKNGDCTGNRLMVPFSLSVRRHTSTQISSKNRTKIGLVHLSITSKNICVNYKSNEDRYPSEHHVQSHALHTKNLGRCQQEKIPSYCVEIGFIWNNANYIRMYMLIVMVSAFYPSSLLVHVIAIEVRGQEGVSFRKVFSAKVKITHFLTFQSLLLHKHYYMPMWHCLIER